MKLHQFSVDHPVFVSMIGCIILILGGISLKYVPIDLMPEVTYPSISVSTTYDDAGPEEIEELISRPIENALSAVAGVKEIRSVSSEENSNVSILFNWGVNLDDAVADVRDRIDRTMRSLPDDVDRPVIRRFNSANMPIMRISVGTNMDLLDARRFLEDQVQSRLERIDGVASAEIHGGHTREIHILFDPDKARSLNTSLSSVIQKIDAGNVTSPAGNLREDRMDVRIRAPWNFSSLDEIRDVIIGVGENGELIRLGDVAEVRDTIAKVTRFVRVNRQPGIQMAIYKQSGANTVNVARQVEEEIEVINRDFATQIKMQALINSADYINLALRSVADSAITGGALAILVLLFFLRNLRSTLIIGISIPMSIIATFVLVYFCGFTLNIMTLGGLALGIGMLVDNAIVVLENITRLRDEGCSRREAAIRGTQEVASAILASTLTTLVVFMPLLFVQGMAGIMFRQFSSVVAFSLTCSFVVAISLVPMLAGKFLQKSIHHDSHEHGLLNKAMAISSRSMEGMENWYSSTLKWVLGHRTQVVVLSLLAVGASLFLIPWIGTELMPKGDEGVVNVTIESEVGTSPEVVNETVKQVEQDIYDVAGKDLKGFFSSAGNSSWRGQGGHLGTFSVRLVGRTERDRTSDQIANEIARKLELIPGIKVRSRSGQGMFVMGAGNAEAVSIDVRGFDLDTSSKIANQLIAIAEATPGVTDAKLSRDLGTPESKIMIDRNKAADLKISVRTAAETLRTILAGSVAGEYREGGDEYDILVKVKDADLLTLEQIFDIGLKNEDGDVVVLKNLLDYSRVKGAVSIERKNQERVLSVAANIFNRDIGSVVNDIREGSKTIPLPPSFSINFSGDYEELVDAFRELAVAFVLALVLVYMVMACQFESLLDPLIVMLSVPLAIIGVLLALFITGSTFNIQSFIGCIMLAGIVVNNAILLVDTANMLYVKEKYRLHVAICEAGRRRLRPILMTTLTTVLGLFPLSLGLGEGGETQAPMARVVIGGLVSSTFITLLFVPAVYFSFARLARRRKAKRLKEQRHQIET